MGNRSNELLIDKDFVLQKMSGKGGWIYVAIPEIEQDKNVWFGMMKVSGSIDNYELSECHLMPMGNGTLFLPVKTAIRKTINKNVGDTVHVTLFSLNLPRVTNNDFMICLEDEPLALAQFQKLNPQEQKKITDRIYSVTNDQLKIERIAEAIECLLFRSGQ